MCTSISYYCKDHYFGRNLDLEYSYNETVTLTKRNYPFYFRHEKAIEKHYALIGIAYVVEDYPLYYDAINEKGLGMAGLNFPGNADYKQKKEDVYNISPFEFIPWVLGQCANIAEAKALIQKTNLINENFSKELPLTPLHWMLADKESSIVVEQMKDGMHIYDNPVGVMSNNPPFEMQLFNLNNYMTLSTEPVKNSFSKDLSLNPYSNGMGAIGLPGDLSSMSRFVKAAFTRMNSLSSDSEEESVSQFFHILSSVEQQRGCVHIKDGHYEITVYSSCGNLDKGIYYYTTYENRRISAIDMHKEDLDGNDLVSYPLRRKEDISYCN